ncbi:MAG: hypothetical protein IBJ18_00895 [Phycisphaerales bacterium]|nr:hypothetical protein [Phycisphaerales bacterium]
MGNNWPQFAIIIFFLLFSAISWTVRKLKEQNEVKRAREMAEAREREMLRTGRDPNAEPLPDLTPPSQQVRPDPMLSPGADRRQLAAEQARAELRRLRQMRSPGAPMHAPAVGGSAQQPTIAPNATGGPAPIRTELWPGGPVIEINPGAGANQPVPPQMPAHRPQQPQSRPAAMQQPMARPPATSAQRRTPTQAQRAQAQQRSDEDRAERAERARKQKALAAKREKESRELARDAREDAEELQRAGLTPVGAQPVNINLPKTPEQWRSALVLNEILGQPLGMRSNQAGDLR